MKILLTNNALCNRAGTELYIRDMAMKLQKLGHQPFVFSTVLGRVANEIREASIPVVHDLNGLSITPDIIHGQHHLETMIAMHHFPSVPAVYFCHGWKPWQEAPPKSSRILRYIAIDNATYERLHIEHGISEDKIEVIFNFADLERFKLKRVLPMKPKKALFYSNYAQANNIMPLIMACREADLDLDIVGLGMQNPSQNPEDLLREYDIVFARGRSAIEAMAVGCAVVLLDSIRSGPMVTSDNVEPLRLANFGIRTREEILNVQAILKEINRYNPKDAKQVSLTIRALSGLNLAIENILQTYQDAIEEFRSCGNFENTSLETANYLTFLAPRLKENEELKARLENLHNLNPLRFCLRKLKAYLLGEKRLS